MTSQKWTRILVPLACVAMVCSTARPARAGFFGDIVDTVSDAIDSAINIVDAATGLSDSLAQGMEAVGSFGETAVTAASSGASSRAIFLGVGGNNKFGSYKQNTDVTLNGKVEAKAGSVVTVGQAFFADSTVSDFVDITQKVVANNISSTNGSEVHLGSVIVYKSTMQSLKVDTDVQAGNITAKNGSRVEIGTFRMTNSEAKAVEFTSKVRMQDAEATDGSAILIGGASL